MPWDSLAIAIVVALVASIAFYPALRHAHLVRNIAWLACTAIVGLSPCLIPPTATFFRFVAALFAITLLVKLYDANRQPRITLELGLRSYVANLANGNWLVRRIRPRRPPMIDDFPRLLLRLSLTLLLVALCWFLFQEDWWTGWFALEHVAKVTVVVAAVIALTNAIAVVYRLVGSEARDFMNNPFIACTPADFWRRWNVPAHEFLNEYVFKPAGGLRHPVRAMLITFGISGLAHEYVFGIAAGRVQGWQLLFFLLQGVAAVANMNVKPKGRVLPICVVGVWVFNLASSVLLFASVNQIVPFYSTPADDS